MTSPRYTPQPIAGYVFYSNYPKLREDKTEWTVEAIEEQISDSFNLPRADICVVPFAPIGYHPSGSAIRWAAFIKSDHSHVVEDAHRHLKMMLEALK